MPRGPKDEKRPPEEYEAAREPKAESARRAGDDPSDAPRPCYEVIE